ncbi:MAG: DEAD/DEAH box helicase [Mobilitalea sp.]
MELKNFQKNVIKDLRRFLELLIEKQSINEAYRILWDEKGVVVGINGMLPYSSVLPGVPQVCLKVPTGGGKTFLAANAIKPIFDSMPNIHPRVVVWLVPSDAILTQTQNTLMSSEHPYREKINVDFGNRVEVYSKSQLLSGQNFNPTSVNEQLSIFVLSYDSFRTSKKEGRKAYQENGNLSSFTKYKTNQDILLENTDETALIQVIRRLNPVVIVDESHHASSPLSIDMLQNFNPSFVLDLTATPKTGSNIISFADAKQLKKEDMVKLPVIVYNRKTQDDVFLSAISIRMKLENEAKKERAESGRYIRPIVLFQAQPKNNADSTTYEKIKNTLIEIGIPEEQIAIKTANKDEIKNINLMSETCLIRYIITVNALKEGWDCPFAYVLATVANRTSTVDVEQILGRVLRLPYTKINKKDVLNLSYVITSSADFFATLDKVVAGLNNAGFSSKDYRMDEIVDETVPTEENPQPVQLQVEDYMGNNTDNEKEDIPIIDTSSLRAQVTSVLNELEKEDARETTSQADEMLNTAVTQNNAYWEEMCLSEETAADEAPQEVRDKMKILRMQDAFSDEAASLLFPQFVVETEPSLFSEHEYALLEKENLQTGFTLKDKDTQIDFSSIDAEMAKVDVDDSENATPKAWQLQGFDSTYMKEWFDAQPSEKKLLHCKNMICKKLSSFNAINDKELNDYVNRVVDNKTEDQLTDLEQSSYPYIRKIEDKVKSLLEIHENKIFKRWLEQDTISCVPEYRLPSTISPTNTIASIPKSLYTEEESMNDYERKVVWELSALANIKWWHRNISRRGFAINGAVTAYPDLIVMTTSGKILLVETKGDHLENDESKAKAETGARWASMVDRIFKYYMVFQTKEPGYQGSYSHDRFMDIVRKL